MDSDDIACMEKALKFEEGLTEEESKIEFKIN